jgi:hypothetical protein
MDAPLGGVADDGEGPWKHPSRGLELVIGIPLELR